MTPKPPKFNLANILKLQHKLRTELAHCVEITLAGDELEQFVTRLTRLLPARTSYTAVYESVQPYIGQQLSLDLFDKLLWRLAGNARLLRCNTPVLPWSRQRTDEWVPVQVTATRVYKNRYGKIGSWVTMRILAGSPCYELCGAFWTRRFSRYFAKALGFSRADGAYPLTHDAELVNLRFLAKINADRSLTKPVPDQYLPFAAGVDWNRQMMRWRARVPDCGHTCPMKYLVTKCFACEVGYRNPLDGRVHCKAATHRELFERRHCSRCKTEALFDPDLNSVICFNCTNAAAVSRKVEERSKDG